MKLKLELIFDYDYTEFDDLLQKDFDEEDLHIFESKRNLKKLLNRLNKDNFHRFLNLVLQIQDQVEMDLTSIKSLLTYLVRVGKQLGASNFSKDEWIDEVLSKMEFSVLSSVERLDLANLMMVYLSPINTNQRNELSRVFKVNLPVNVEPPVAPRRGVKRRSKEVRWNSLYSYAKIFQFRLAR